MLEDSQNFNWWFYKIVHNFWLAGYFSEIPSDLEFSDHAQIAWDTLAFQDLLIHFQNIFSKKNEKKSLFF